MKALLLGGFALAAQHAYSSVVITGTRVIYPAQEPEVTVRLSNEGKLPALIQVWMDNGDADAAPSDVDVPFMITPPVARIDPGKGQALRVFYTGEALPQNRESVFWLNVLEVPPKPSVGSGDTNVLQMAFRTRIKLFFRPPQLVASGAVEAPAKIQWRLVREGNNSALQAHNPSAFHVSFSALAVQHKEASVNFQDAGMIGPGETKILRPQNDAAIPLGSKVIYSAISDYGGSIQGEAPLN